MSEKKTLVKTSPKSAENAIRMIAALKSSKVLNLDVPISTVENLLHAPGLEEVAGYVLAWDKYVLVVGKESTNINPVEVVR
jgi:hypothetical protein